MSKGLAAFDRETQPGVSNLLVIQSALTGEKIDDIVVKYEGKHRLQTNEQE